MASRSFSEIRTLNRGIVAVLGSFTIDGAGAVSAAKGIGVTPTYLASAGKFRLTFEDAFPELLSAQLQFQNPSAASDQFMQIGAYSASNKTLDINLWDVSGAALANVAGQLHFVVYFRNSSE
jgi:hypothetical protein